jgi:hypothetical protein
MQNNENARLLQSASVALHARAAAYLFLVIHAIRIIDTANCSQSPIRPASGRCLLEATREIFISASSGTIKQAASADDA